MVNEIIEKISHFFAENRALSMLLLVTTVVLGLVAFLVMPKQYNPEIVRPAFVVSFAYEGASTESAIDRVGYELVEKLQVIPGVEDILTRVTAGTTITSTIIFAVGHDATEAKADLMTQLEGHSYLASGAVTTVSIQEINPETIPVMQVVFSSPTKTQSEVREAVLALREKLLTVSGVSELSVVGGEERAVLIEVDPVKLSAARISYATFKQALAHTELKVTQVGFENETYAIATALDARVLSLEDIGLLPLTPSVRLRDVARVYEGVSPHRSYTLHVTEEGEVAEVVMLAVSKQEGASAPAVTASISNVLEETASDDLAYLVVSDDGDVANTEILGLTTNLVTSVAIVGVILLLFLSFRAALVVLITVPLTFLAVLTIGWLFGETINRITLFALILSLGLLVDASIVVVDNIYAHLQEAYRHGRAVSPAKIAAGAVREVGVGLVLSALTSVIVFVPLFFITGMMGPYMGPIAFFVPMALIASLVIAIVLTPFLSAELLRVDVADSKISTFFQGMMERVTEKYVKLLHTISYEPKVRQRLLVGALGAFIFSLVFPLTGLVHFQMLPKADRNQVYVYIDVPKGTAREATRAFTEEVAELATAHEAVTSAQLFVAGAPIADFNGLFKGTPMRTAYDQATVRLNLVSAADREKSSTEITTELRALFAQELKAQAAYVRLMEEPPGPPVIATLVMKVRAPATEVQRQAVADLFSFVQDTEGVVDEYQSLDASVEELTYELDRERIMAAGVQVPEVVSWFSLLGAPQVAGEYLASGVSERVPLYVRVPSTYTESPAQGESLPVMSAQGSVPFGNLMNTSYALRPVTEYLEAAESVQYVTAEVEGRSIVYVTIELITKLIQGDLPGYTVTDWNLFGLSLVTDAGAEVQVRFGGEWEMTLENFRDLGVAMLAALFLIYGILVAQYGSFSTPGFILVTVPLGLVGILLGFFVLDTIFGIYLTATALIGFIALIGIVVNNAIIYLEYVDQAVAEGTTFRDALIAAGAARLRPIALTSLTTVLGSLTIASDPVWSGLAWAIIFGLSLSTVLTLIIFPALLLQFSKRAAS
jgi:multidrug efflux pump subunit AcrB